MDLVVKLVVYHFAAYPHDTTLEYIQKSSPKTIFASSFEASTVSSRISHIYEVTLVGISFAGGCCKLHHILYRSGSLFLTWNLGYPGGLF